MIKWDKSAFQKATYCFTDAMSVSSKPFGDIFVPILVL